MKLLLLIFSFFAPQFSYCQNNLKVKIKALIENPENGFQKFRGRFKQLTGTDSVFRSSILVDGTRDNEIILSSAFSMYMAIITDSVGNKEGRRMIDDWEKNLGSFLGDKWQLKKLEITAWNPALYGWRFVCDELTISITLYSGELNDSYIVKLGIDYFIKSD